MIAKIQTGRSFRGVVHYLFEGYRDDKTANKQTEILAANGVRLGSVDQIIADFNRHRTLNPDLGQAVCHTALSFHESDLAKLTTSELIEIAEDYMRELDIDPANTQWLLVRHYDTDHPHVHLLMSRVDFNGRTISSQYNWEHSYKAAKKVAVQHELTVAADKQQPNTRYGKALSPERIAARDEIKAFVEDELPHSNDLEDLASRLQAHQVGVHFQRRKKSDGGGSITGITFDYAGHYLRGSSLGEGFNAGALANRIPAQATKPVRSETLQNTCSVDSETGVAQSPLGKSPNRIKDEDSHRIKRKIKISKH